MKAHELIAKPENWTKCAAARNKNGEPVFESSPQASSFCMIGAIARCYGPDEFREFVERLVNYLRIRKGAVLISNWNDDPARTHEEVLEVLKELDI